MLRHLWKDQSGSVAVYSALFTILALSAGTVSIDVGRLVTLKAQMQHRADAGASAGAMQRARDVAANASTDASNIASNTGAMAVASVNFYTEYSPNVAATSDSNARIIEVIMTPQLVDFYFTPFLGLLIDQVTADHQTVTAASVAQFAPIMCHAPPLMVCDLTETGGEDVMDPANIGRQILVKSPQGSNALWAPGNFGLLESGYGSGANNLEIALADIEAPGCDSNVITTEPGTMANRVKDGINARFNGSSYYTPAPNVQTYPRDTAFDAEDADAVDPGNRLGDGDWDVNDYWATNHPGDWMDSDVRNATRYQMYLYELGETYAANGNQTIYPSPDTLPAGFTNVIPPYEDLPATGEPDTIPASNGALRRVMQVAVLKCVAEEVRGRGDYPTDGNYIEVFLTEPVGDPPATAIYGEIIGRLTPDETMSFHSDARILD
jgi:Flp pilus assembly protein TadG